MPDIFEPMIRKLLDMGIGNLLIFILALAIIYALMKKSKVFGDSDVINGVIAFCVAFMIFMFPVLYGVNLFTSFATFWTQGLVLLLFVIFGFVAASLFYPDLPKMLAERFTHRSALWIMIALGVVLFVTSGLVTTFFAGANVPAKEGEIRPPTEVITLVAGVIIFIVVLMIASSAVTHSH
jgi:hypothetical protein